MKQNLNIDTKNKSLINITIYESSNTRNILIINSATGVKQDFYEKFSEFMEQNQITVVTYDYHGIGKSLYNDLKSLNNSLYDWGNNDFEAVLLYCTEKYPDSNLTVLGHSIGGQIIGLTEKAISINKIILVCAQSGYWGHWSGFNKMKMWLNWNVLFPTLINLCGYMPSKKFSGMENLPKNVAKEWRNWCISKNYLFDCLNSNKVYYSQINTNIISYSIDDDDYAPRKAVEWMTSKFCNTKIESKHIFPKDLNQKYIGHFGLFKNRFEKSFWEEIKNKILE